MKINFETVDEAELRKEESQEEDTRSYTERIWMDKQGNLAKYAEVDCSTQTPHEQGFKTRGVSLTMLNYKGETVQARGRPPGNKGKDLIRVGTGKSNSDFVLAVDDAADYIAKSGRFILAHLNAYRAKRGLAEIPPQEVGLLPEVPATLPTTSSQHKAEGGGAATEASEENEAA